MDLFAILIDIVMLGVFLTTIARYYYRGFFVSLISVIGSIVAIVAALLLANPVAEFVFETFMRSGITARVEASLQDTLPQQSVLVLVEGFTESMPASLTENLENFNILQSLEDFFNSGIAITGEGIVNTSVAPIMISVTSAVIFFFLLFIIKLGFSLVEKLFTFVDHVPVVSQLNSLLGGVIGIIPGAINVILVFSALVLIAMFTSGQVPIINTETLYSTFSGNLFDIVLNAVSGFFTP